MGTSELGYGLAGKVSVPIAVDIWLVLASCKSKHSPMIPACEKDEIECETEPSQQGKNGQDSGTPPERRYGHLVYLFLIHDNVLLRHNSELHAPCDIGQEGQKTRAT